MLKILKEYRKAIITRNRPIIEKKAREFESRLKSVETFELRDYWANLYTQYSI